jgi:type IV secretory pathway protease TraF
LHLGTLAAVDRRRGLYWRGLTQEVPLVDFVGLTGAAVVAELPMVTVTVFGIDSPVGVWACAPATEPARDHRLRVLRYPAESATIAQARAVLAGAPCPFDLEEPA